MLILNAIYLSHLIIEFYMEEFRCITTLGKLIRIKNKVFYYESIWSLNECVFSVFNLATNEPRLFRTLNSHSILIDSILIKIEKLKEERNVQGLQTNKHAWWELRCDQSKASTNFFILLNLRCELLTSHWNSRCDRPCLFMFSSRIIFARARGNWN